MSTLGRLLATGTLLAALAGCGSGADTDTAETDPVSAPTATPTSSPAAAPVDASRDAAAAYVAFAESGDRGRGVPWSETVQYSIAGQQVATLSRDFAERRESWVRCPAGTTTYEGRDCPVSPLTTLWHGHRDGAEPTYETVRPETVGCNRYTSQWDGLPIIWVRPAEEDRDCFTDYAIAVAVEDGEIVAVDLFLSGP